jgi:formylglycine-generating enzyme required for sulfatase activity
MGLIWKNTPDYLLDAARLGKISQFRPALESGCLISNAAGTGVILKAGTIIPLKSGGTWKAYEYTADTEATALDTGVLTLGADYCVYLCDDGSDVGKLLISANVTAPSGYTTDNSVKIGGFHYGRVRIVNSDWVPVDGVNAVYGANATTPWEANVTTKIAPNSVWDMINRPICDPAGMAKVGNFWMDIYPASQSEAISVSNGKLAGGRCRSAYNATPLTGTENLFFDIFNELAARSGKYIPTYRQWKQGAEGSPQGNDGDNVNAWSATTNTGRNPTGGVERAISARNIVDCVGNVWEWTASEVVRWDDTGAAGQAWGWKDSMSGQGVGQLYMYDEQALVNILAGGHWINGLRAGSRCGDLSDYPWHVATYIGCRFACDSLKSVI